jgi:UDP-N-acetylglucosamine--N-acetylmuramyl-(pentapeptide) pyrophosphoryl-undecaprenol N-acetylglucosamine transferase
LGERWDVIVTAGGTGGHVLPALAVVDALSRAGVSRDRIGFVGGRSGQETTLVPAAGVGFVGLDVRGARRSLRPSGIAANARAGAALVGAMRQARMIVRDSGTRVVCGMGGYASLPCVLAAPRRVPVVLYESNSVPGLAVRLGARRAVIVGCAFDAAARRLPHAKRMGFIVRPEIAVLDRAELRDEARRTFGLPPEARVVAVIGGSQGARTLNQAVLRLAAWSTPAGRATSSLSATGVSGAEAPGGQAVGNTAFLHLTGRRDHDDVVRMAGRLGLGAPSYVPLAFEDRMDLVYAAADVVVARSGAATCAELAVTGIPAVLVPYPHATADHQRHNAEELAATGAAVIVDDAEVGPDTLAAAIRRIDDVARTDGSMSPAARRVGTPDGTGALCDVIVGLLDGRAGEGKALLTGGMP